MNVTQEELDKAHHLLEALKQKRERKSLEELTKIAQAKDAKREKKLISVKKKKAEERLELMLNYKEEPEILIEIKPASIDKEWDVTLNDEIKFFDPELSYELTGYRPITKDKGLDFNPALFTEAADTYLKTGKYTNMLPNTFKWINHWKQEFDRCQNGITIGKYTLTGLNYFFLNYYRLLSPVKKKDDTSGSKRAESFPTFIAKLYEYFHYLELCKKAGFDGLAFKSRGVGASEIAASNCAHAYTFIKESYNIVTAFLEKYVRGTLRKTWLELDFLNLHTEGAFKRVRLKTDTDLKKVASLVDKQKNEFGWKSTIEGITADTPDKLRGDRVDNLYFEESGNNVNLIETYSRARALVDILGARVGNRYIFGCVCAGTKVWTREGQYKNIEDLIPIDGIIGFKNNLSNIEPITHLNPPAEKPCVRITLKDGTILDCSEDHPILLRKRHHPRNKVNKQKRETYFTWDFVLAKDIMKLSGPKIVAQCNKIDKFGTDTLFDPYLVGLLIGDGTYGHDCTPVLSNCDSEVLNYVKNKYNWKLRHSHITTSGKVYEEIAIKNICKNLRWIGIYGQTKTEKRLPLFYSTLDKENSKQLLAGLFDTDGYIDTKTHKITLTQSSREILEEVLVLLYKFGIYSTINKVEPQLNKNRKDKNPWFVLSINDKLSQYNFAQEIPIKISYKKSAAEKACLRIDKHLCESGIREVSVVSVESIGILPIYNLTAGDSNTYLANNIITHNTSGEQGPKLAGLKTMFFDPKGYDILPYLNRHMLGEPLLTGYFIPSYSMWLGNPPGTGFDVRGVVNEDKAKEYYKIKWSKITDSKTLIIDKAEYCFTPEDAFVLEGCNNFDQEKLVDLKAAIEIHHTVEKPKYMKLHWLLTEGMPDINKIPSVEVCERSSILFTEMPMRDENGIAFKNLYVIGIDGIDADAATSTGLADVSKFCIIVYRRQIGIQPPKIVALYKERPKHIKDAWETALKLATFYNAKVLVEATRTSVILYFILNKKDYYLMHRPHATANLSGKTNYKLYGVPAPEHVILHYIDLIELYISDYCELICFTEVIDELISYSYENKRKFDIVAALGMSLLADEELIGKVARTNSFYTKKLSIGYSRNEYGQVQLGQTKNKENNARYDWFRARSETYD